MLLNLSKSTLSRISGVLETVENLLIQKTIKPNVSSTNGLRFIHAARIVRLSSPSLSALALLLIAISQSFERIWKRI